MMHASAKARTPLLLFAALLALTFCARPSAQTLIDIATDATDPCNFPDAEPSIAVNPRNPQEIVVLTFSEGWGPSKHPRTDVPCKPAEDEPAAPLWRSEDGGATWRKEFIIPRFNSAQDGPIDQRVTFDAAGRLLIVAMDAPGSVSRFYRQNESSAPALVFGAGFVSDQPQLEVDRFAAGRCFDRVYSSWRKANNPFDISFVSSSADRGARVSEVPVGNTNFPNRTARVAVAPDGAVYVVYKTEEGRVDARFQRARFRVVRSDDCGQTWGPVSGGAPIHGEATATTWFTEGGTGFGNAAKGRTNRANSSDAWVAVDPASGAVYVAYVDVDSSSGFSQIVVARSDDRGGTWVSSRIPNEGRHCAYPEVAVASNGAVGVLYVDMDDSGASTIFRHRFAKSFDQGATWPAAEQKTLQSMDPAGLDNDDHPTDDYLWGDYEGLTAEGDAFYGVFTGESINRQQRQLDPIFFKEPTTPMAVASKQSPRGS
jgi:hypothetical protein